MRTVIFILCSILSFHGRAELASDYLPIIWNDLAVENHVVHSVFEKTNKELANKKVVIPGFVIKSHITIGTDEKTGEEVKRLVLSPRPKICEHVPPPHANQLIKIVNSDQLDLTASEVPVYLFGTLKLDESRNGLFSTAYTLELEGIDSYMEVEE